MLTSKQFEQYRTEMCKIYFTEFKLIICHNTFATCNKYRVFFFKMVEFNIYTVSLNNFALIVQLMVISNGDWMVI